MATRINYGGSGKPVTNTNWAQQNIKRMEKEILAKDKTLPELNHKPFTKKEDVDKYLSGEKIMCLECGAMMTKVGGMHLKKHGLTAELYKEKYNIPKTRGLLSAELSETMSRNQKTPKARLNQNKLAVIGATRLASLSKEELQKKYKIKTYEAKVKTFTCEECGKEFDRDSIVAKKHHRFCSHSCCMQSRWKDKNDPIYAANVFVKRSINK